MAKKQKQDKDVYDGPVEAEVAEAEVIISQDVAYYNEDFSHIAHDKKRDMLKALQASVGIVSTAAKKARISRRIHYIWMKEDPEYREAVREVEEIDLDFAESCLRQQMRAGSTAATIYYLKCRGGSRGYIETQSYDVTSNGKEVSIAPISFFSTEDGDENK